MDGKLTTSSRDDAGMKKRPVRGEPGTKSKIRRQSCVRFLMEMSIERSIVAVRNGVVEKFGDMVGLVYHGIVVLWRMADHFIFFARPW